jgi:hypothetical protein
MRDNVANPSLSNLLKDFQGVVMPQHHHPYPKADRKLHKDWRMWMVVILMLAAIMIYVLTLDDSLLSLVVATMFC